MADWFIAFIFAAGVSGWVYAKFTNRTGNASASNNLVVIAITFVAVFVVMFTLLKFVFHF